jgi:uncharacterized RDD family membrane protein YckC
VVVWPIATAVMMGFTGGQTIGKAVAAIRVLDADGSPAGFGTSLLRDALFRGLFFLIPIGTFVDHLWALGEDGQTLHDKMAGTYVVEDEAPYRDRGKVLVLFATLAVGGLTALLVAGGYFEPTS